jgi:ABC-2 type transport system permease protein
VVRHFVGLKARLTWNGIRHDRQRRFGFPIATALLTWLAFWLAGGHLDAVTQLRAVDGGAVPHYLAWVALIGFAAWITLPVIIFPLDENLDPQQLAVLPVDGNRMVAGLSAASLVAPATIVPVVLLTVNAVAMPGAWWMVVPASMVYLALLVVGGQLFSASVSAILRTRRGRDIATFLILGLAAASFMSYRAVVGAIETLGLAGAARSVALLDWAAVVPPVAAQRAIFEASAGNPFSALLFLGAALVGLGLMAAAWRSLLGWMLTTPKEGSRPAARARTRGMATGMWGVVANIARKEFRFYMRDPRQRLVWTGTVIFVGLAVAGSVMGSAFIDIRESDWAPLFAPILVLFVGLPIALNLFGWERNAASYLFVLPVTPKQMLLGKNLAVGTALLIETSFLAIGIAAFTGHWRWLWLVFPLMVAAIGSQMAVGNLVSVLTPLRLPREGTDVFAQSTEQGCLAIVAQTVSFFTIGLLLVIPASAVTLTVAFGQALAPWITTLISLVWGVVVYLTSLAVSSRLLRRRLPEVMAWVQIT